jgi:hypothetical protein
MDRSEVMGRVHRRFADTEPELENGFAEHATMGVEAMLALGLDPDSVDAWAERHLPTPTSHGSTQAVARDAIAPDLVGDGWPTVLQDHVVRLVGNLDVHLFHGLIRTAHAVRAIDTYDSPEARRELATGLAAWTIWAGDTPTEPHPSSAADPIAEVLEMARRGAAAFVTAPSIITIHAVTAPMAYLLMADHLTTSTHAIAASVFTRTHRRYTAQPSRPDDRPFPATTNLQSLAERWDAHPVKLVEAAQRGYALTDDAAFLDAVETMTI